MHGDDVLPTGDRLDERVFTERSEVAGEALEVVVGHRLIREGHDVVLEPRRADLGDGALVERAGQVDPLAGRRDLE